MEEYLIPLKEQIIKQANRMIPKIETEIIPHAGHLLSIEQPEILGE
jgi:pimeloyl-ACP methyl ester carboxylesterase